MADGLAMGRCSWALGTVAAAALLTACGGGSSSSTDGGGNTTVTLSGKVVVDGAIRNTLVCLDLNGNGVCDGGEPASARTGADGAYSLTFDSTLAGASAASLIATMVPGPLSAADTTVDVADPTEGNTARAYVLRQVPGKGGQISPLTTLLAAGMAAGMTEAQARSNAAAQLAIAETKLDDYQDDPAFSDAAPLDNARLMAKLVAAALEEDIPLQVADQQARVAEPYDLRRLVFSDANNYSFLQFELQALAAGTPGVRLTDLRAGRSAGSELSSQQLYTQAYLTPAGWLRCDASRAIVSTSGTPSRSQFCDAETSVSMRKSVSIAGRPMSEVVNEVSASGATLFSLSNGTGALGSARFPDGSALRTGLSLRLSQPWFVNNLNTDARSPSEATTLEQLIASKPAAAVNLANGAGSLGLGTMANGRNLRVAFGTSGTVAQYYECDVASATTVANCSASGSGNYVIETVNGSRVMRFTGHVATGLNQERGYAEIKASAQVNTVTNPGDWVYQVRRYLPGVANNLDENTQRLNYTGWAAMKTQLGL